MKLFFVCCKCGEKKIGFSVCRCHAGRLDSEGDFEELGCSKHICYECMYKLGIDEDSYDEWTCEQHKGFDYKPLVDVNDDDVRKDFVDMSDRELLIEIAEQLRNEYG